MGLLKQKTGLWRLDSGQIGIVWQRWPLFAMMRRNYTGIIHGSAVMVSSSFELTELFKAAQAGDKVAYSAFLTQLSPLLRRVIGRKIPISDVEDVLQEVLISIHKARHTYDGARPLMPWLMAITSFRLADHLRKSYSTMRHQTTDIADYENTLVAVTETPEVTESINRMLDGIPERERKILSMMHMEGYTAKQVGTTLGMKESAVKVAAHRAIRKLREQLRHG